MPATSLLLFTTSQTPLPNRYPTPAGGRALPVPPLLHASLHLAVDRPGGQPPSYTLTEEGVLMIPDPEDEIDAINGTRAAAAAAVAGGGSAGADEDAEITVKFYLVSASPAAAAAAAARAGPSTAGTPPRTARAKQEITRALRNLAHYKAHDPRWRGDRARRGIDTFLIGWKGVEYRGEDGEGPVLSEEQKREMAEIWTDLPRLVPQAKRLGTLSLPLPLLQYLEAAGGGGEGGGEVAGRAEDEPEVERRQGPGAGAGLGAESTVTETDKSLLAALIPAPAAPGPAPLSLPAAPAPLRPAVNCLNTPDCHSLPPALLSYAASHGISLWAGEAIDPLPSAHLHNTLHEFVPRFPPAVFPPDTRLARQVPLEPEAEAEAPAVDVQWVLGYTVISRSRSVVQDKGYIISAALP